MDRGIDVSSYQGNIDWKKVKADGVAFAILKVIRKDLSTDKKFEQNWIGCEDAGVTVQGVYNYSYATSAVKAKADALKVVNILADRKPMVWLDVEDACQKGIGQKLIDIILAYRAVIVGAGMQFGVYTGLSFYKSYILPYQGQIMNIPFWIARYPSSTRMDIRSNPSSSYKPVILPTVYGWQYSSKGAVNGVPGDVDMNEWYVDVEAEKTVEESKEYDRDKFITDSSKVWNTNEKAEMIKKSVTVSTQKNKNHDIVTPLERYFTSLGYYSGTIEADLGKQPAFGNGMKKATKLYQEHIVKADERNRDGILTAGCATWKALYK